MAPAYPGGRRTIGVVTLTGPSRTIVVEPVELPEPVEPPVAPPADPVPAAPPAEPAEPAPAVGR
jgi:hypothetical protein